MLPMWAGTNVAHPYLGSGKTTQSCLGCCLPWWRRISCLSQHEGRWLFPLCYNGHN